MINNNLRNCENKSWLSPLEYESSSFFLSFSLGPGADAIKKFTPSLGIPYLGV